MILDIMLDQALAFFASVSVANRSRYLFCFVVLKFNDKLPLRYQRALRHVCI